MSRLEFTKRFDRPPDEVFRFIATDHVRNHPRWDPKMQLEQITPGPIAVGTRIRRRNRHGDQEIEGEMEVVELEPGRVFGLVIRDGPVELRSRMTFVPEETGGTMIVATIESDIDLEGMDPAIERSLDNMKRLIESE